MDFPFIFSNYDPDFDYLDYDFQSVEGETEAGPEEGEAKYDAFGVTRFDTTIEIGSDIETFCKEAAGPAMVATCYARDRPFSDSIFQHTLNPFEAIGKEDEKTGDGDFFLGVRPNDEDFYEKVQRDAGEISRVLSDYLRRFLPKLLQKLYHPLPSKFDYTRSKHFNAIWNEPMYFDLFSESLRAPLLFLVDLHLQGTYFDQWNDLSKRTPGETLRFKSVLRRLAKSVNHLKRVAEVGKERVES